MVPTAVITATLLGALYRQDRTSTPAGLTPADRTTLANYLSGHQHKRMAAWDLWRTELELTGQDTGDAAYWLDVEFVEPCPED